VGADQGELERLYRERYIGFRNALATVTGSYETARDAVQEAFSRALQQRHQFRGEGSLAAWVWRIALRAALEQREHSPAAPSNGALDPALTEPERDPELAEALRTLPPRRRLVVFLHYFADLSYCEIAELTGVTEGTVAATLAQARARLREALDARQEPGGARGKRGTDDG
jgi:RNA polymerase sigma-70 factor (ECF subfamily)